MKKLLENRKIRTAALAALLIIALFVAFIAGASLDQMGVDKENSTPMGGWDKVEDGGGDHVNNNVGTSGSVGIGGSGSSANEGRKIIKTVSLTAQTDSYDSFISNLKMKIAEAGGRIDREYASGEDYYSKNNLRQSSFTIRIPAESLGDFTVSIEGMCTVSSYRENINDVTEAYIDTESRISVLSAKEKALLEMLEKAENITDLLAIDARLTSVQSELESLKAQKESYDDRIAYSTVTLTVNEVKYVEIKNPTFGESVKLEFVKSMESLSDGVESLGVFIFGNIIYIVIFAALMAIVVPVLLKLTKNRKEKRKTYNIPPAVSPASEPENSTETTEKDNKA